MNSKQYTLGQFETPLNVADLLVGLSVQRPTDRVLDPSCGEGILLDRTATWMRWLAASPHTRLPGVLYGVELDAEAVQTAVQSVPDAQITTGNYLALTPDDLGVFDAIVGNPPYTPAERIGSLHEDGARQLSIFSWAEDPEETPKYPLISHRLADSLSGRSGLHAYYLIHSTEFFQEGGLLACIVPNGWLDVAYGVELKQYLLDHHRIVAIIESAVERWFEEAWINTCIILLAKCSNLSRRQANLVHLARLKQPLQQLLPYSATSSHRFIAIERLVSRLLPGHSTVSEEADVHVKVQQTLLQENKWGMALRAPMVFRHHRDHLNLAPLKMWAQVQRGYTTGANEFFYLTPDTVEEWGIEETFRHPLLKSLRGIDRLQLATDDTHFEVFLVPPEADLKGTAAAQYVAWGEEQGFHQRTTCAGRDPWYIFPVQTPAHLVMPKGIWHRHFAPLLSGGVAVDQQLYQFVFADFMPLTAIAALLNSAWFALQVELRGRVSFGKGLLWLAAYELEEAQLPDPRQLTEEQVQRLDEAFMRMAERPLTDGLTELKMPDRRGLDEAVFDILGFSAREREDTFNSLVERMASRIQRAA